MNKTTKIMNNYEKAKEKISELRYKLSEIPSEGHNNPLFQEAVSFLYNYEEMFRYSDKLLEKYNCKRYYSVQKEYKMRAIVRYYHNKIGELVRKSNEINEQAENIAKIITLMAMSNGGRK